MFRDRRSRLTRLCLCQSNEAKYIVKTYNRPPIVFTRGKGSVLYDTNGACHSVASLRGAGQR